MKTNPKLKEWWKNMKLAEKTEWWRRWQKLNAKGRSDVMAFIEKGIVAQELLQDEIDAFITFDKWCDGKGTNFTEAQLLERWVSEIESCKSECLFLRGQWLLPRFEGVERRNRTRHSQEISMYRQVNIHSAEQMTQLWQAGQQALERFKGSIRPPTSAAPLRVDPAVHARLEDMPTVTRPKDALFDSISREVTMR